MGAILQDGDYGLQDLLNRAIQVKAEIEGKLSLLSKGYYNPTMNSTIDGVLTSTPNPNLPDGAYYESDSVGVSQITGANFAIGDQIRKGDKIQKNGTHWSLIPNPTDNYSFTLETENKLKVISHVSGEIVEGFANNNGDVNLVSRVIIAPNTVSANETGLRFVVKRDKDWNAGDLLYIEVLVSENTASMTNYNGQQLKFNLNVKRGTSTIIVDVAASTKFQRVSAQKVLLSFTYVITSTDTDFIYVLQKPAGSTLNNSGGTWMWTVNELNQHVTKLGETLPPIAAELHDLSLDIDKNTYDIQNSQLSYAANSVTMYGDSNNGGVFSENTVTVPVGQTGANSSVGMIVSLSDSPFYDKMAGKRIFCDYIANVSTDLLTKRSFSCQAYPKINGEYFPGKALNLTVKSIDPEHVKVSFEMIVETGLTHIRTYLEFYDQNVVSGSPQKIELSNKFYFYWLDPTQRNINTAVFERTLALFNSTSFAGKKIVWCGTSIPWYYQPNSYPELTCRRLGATLYNTAIAGSRVLFNTDLHLPGMAGSIAQNVALHPDFVSYSYENTIMKYLAPPYNCKVVVWDHVYNDCEYFPNYLGNINDTTIGTYYGGADFIFKQILNNYPDVQIIMATFPGKYPNGSNALVSLYDLGIVANKELAKKWGFPLITLAEYMGFNQITQVAGKKTIDGIHQTADQTVEISKVLYRFMTSIS